MNKLQQRADKLALIMKLSYLAMLVLLTLGTWVVVPEGREPSVSIFLIRLLPLLVFLPLLWRPNLRGLAWLCFVSLGYFVVAVINAMSPLALWLDYLQLAFIVSLFCSAMWFIRVQARAWNTERALREEQ